MNHHHFYSYMDPNQLPPTFNSTISSANNTCPTPPCSVPPYSSSLPSYFPHTMPQLFSPTSDDLFDASLTRAFSAEDLQVIHGKQDGGVIHGRVGRYSAEERKERIERYRSKRNQRNFQKKITYACRKTLADSRPRVRGRFARNGETETETTMETSYYYGHGYSNEVKEEEEEEEEEEEACSHNYDEEDDEMWATFLNGISMNLPS